MTRLLTWVLVFGGLLISSPATGDDDFATRGGPSFGIGIGLVHATCETGDCAGAGSGAFDLHLGMMFSSRLGVTLDVWGMAAEGDDASVRHGILSIGPRVWPLSSLWVHAGLGLARAHIVPLDVDVESRTSYDPAWVAAIGWEAITIDDLAFDVQLRATDTTLAGDRSRVRAVGLGIGATWY